MNKIVIAIIIVLAVATMAIAANMHFSSTLPGATYGTRGTNEKLELQKAAIEELRTKMNNWATYTGYSTGTNR